MIQIHDHGYMKAETEVHDELLMQFSQKVELLTLFSTYSCILASTFTADHGPYSAYPSVRVNIAHLSARVSLCRGSSDEACQITPSPGISAQSLSPGPATCVGCLGPSDLFTIPSDSGVIK